MNQPAGCRCCLAGLGSGTGLRGQGLLTRLEIFADYWPKTAEEIPFTGLLNGVPKYVASRTLAGALAWRGSTLVDEIGRAHV